MEYIEANLNPTGKKVGDCVVRAIMKATNQTWKKTFTDLCEIGVQVYAMPNDKKIYGIYLDSKGWKKQPMPKRQISCINTVGGISAVGKTYKRYTVKEFANENPKGTFIISVANHLTCLVDGTLYDTWNCQNKSLGNYWK